MLTVAIEEGPVSTASNDLAYVSANDQIVAFTAREISPVEVFDAQLAQLRTP